jgi:hypothetical protein
VSQQQVLVQLEQVLEAFLDRVVTFKEPRLRVLEGINRLDDIARTTEDSLEMTDRIGEWFAANNPLLNEKRLRAADVNRISGILGEIRSRLDLTDEAPPAMHKISSEIERWKHAASGEREKIVLRRGPEQMSQPAPAPHPAPTAPDDSDSIARFERFFEHAHNLFKDFSGNKKHLLSALDDSLLAATVGKNKDALILSAFIIYYLKQNGYKVEPFVKRLKKAEELIKGGLSHAEA